MSANLKALAGMQFGCPVIEGVILQDLTVAASGKVAESYDEDGDPVGFAIHGKGKFDVSGSYTYKGSDIGDIGDAITIPDMPADAGDVYLIEFDRKRTSQGFTAGSFKAISVTGITEEVVEASSSSEPA